MKKISVRRTVGAVALACATAVAATSLPWGFVHHGDFRRMAHTGDTAGKVALAALPQLPGTWGVGASAGLRGEIVQIDGRLLVSLGSDPRGAAQAPGPDAQATLFASARVAQWTDLPIAADMDAQQFEAFLRQQATALGLSLEHPFVFRVTGRFAPLKWHVVTGEAPPAAGHHRPGGHGSPAHGARPHSGMRVFDQPGAAGQLVGVYSGAALEGVVSHPGERLHLHFVDTQEAVSGHVDVYAVKAGSVLKLPVR